LYPEKGCHDDVSPNVFPWDNASLTVRQKSFILYLFYLSTAENTFILLSHQSCHKRSILSCDTVRYGTLKCIISRFSQFCSFLICRERHDTSDTSLGTRRRQGGEDRRQAGEDRRQGEDRIREKDRRSSRYQDQVRAET
jgi:hypothetical protein